MGFGFRKSISLGGGLRLNLGGKSMSLSGGIRGLRGSVGTRGARVRASVPGTGVYYDKKLKKQMRGSGGGFFSGLVMIYRLTFALAGGAFVLYFILTHYKK